MAKMSAINKNNKRIKLSDKFYKKRSKLKKIIMDKKLSLEERFKAQQKLSKLPRNSAKVRTQFWIIKTFKFSVQRKKEQLMAKMSAINKNNRRIKLSDKFYKKRLMLKKIIMDKKLPLEERFKAQQKLSKLPRNSSKVRVMNRCQITGRPHGVYRKLKISRIALRQLGLEGKIPGMVKSSW